MSDMINTETINKLKMSGLIELKSVGSLLDPDIGCIYPQFSGSGEPDLSLEISLYDGEVSADWYESLSEEDYEIVKPYIQ